MMRRPKRHLSKKKLVIDNELLRSKLKEVTTDALKELNKLHTNAALKELNKLRANADQCSRIIEAAAGIDFRRNDRDGSYCLNLEFNPQFMVNVSAFRQDMRMVADMVSSQVYSHISSAHFVKMADDNYRRNRPRQYPEVPGYREVPRE